MYTLRLTRVPENGTLKEAGLQLSLKELGLAVPFDPEGVLVDLELTRMMDKVYGKLKAKASVTQTCGRCLKEFHQPVRADFSAIFEPTRKGEPLDPEADDGELSVAYFDGDELPVGEELRQELELCVPFSPLCSKSCPGLCPVCGKDLNDGDCGCPREQDSGPFAALKAKFKPEQEP